MTQFQITYENASGTFRDNQKDMKSLVEIMDCLYEYGSVIIGTKLFMAKHIITIEQF